MSSLTHIEKRYLENILGMHSGYVLDFSDRTFGEFFDEYNIDIHDIKYQTFGTSKANKLRAFWASEPDQLVGRVLSGMLNSYETDCDINDTEMDLDKRLLEKVHGIIGRLTSQSAVSDSSMKILIDYANSRDFNNLLNHINLLRDTVESNSELAIGTAKDLLEAICRTILEDYNIQPQKEKLPKLVKIVSKQLGLLPEDISDDKKGSDAIRRVLNSLAQVTQGVAELRNLYGTGHGYSAHRQSGIQSRHARLVVNSVITVVTFWIETLDERQKSKT